MTVLVGSVLTLLGVNLWDFKILKRIKSVSGVKIFVIFSVGTLYLAVMSWRVGFDELVSYPTLFEARLKQCGSGIFRVSEPLGKFHSVIGLNTFNRKFKGFEHMLQKYGRTI